jgi:hypothetical protein
MARTAGLQHARNEKSFLDTLLHRHFTQVRLLKTRHTALAGACNAKTQRIFQKEGSNLKGKLRCSITAVIFDHREKCGLLRGTVELPSGTTIHYFPLSLLKHCRENRSDTNICEGSKRSAFNRTASP